MALAPGRSSRHLGADVQLQPLRWSTVRGVWLAWLPATSTSGAVAAMDRGDLCRCSVGFLALSSFSRSMDLGAASGVYVHLGWAFRSHGDGIQCIGAGSSSCDHDAFGIQFVLELLAGLSRQCTRPRPPSRRTSHRRLFPGFSRLPASRHARPNLRVRAIGKLSGVVGELQASRFESRRAMRIPVNFSPLEAWSSGRMLANPEVAIESPPCRDDRDRGRRE